MDFAENVDVLAGLGDAPVSYKLYGGEVELMFDEQEHAYTVSTPDGMRIVPSVTTITHIIDKSSALMQWAANKAVEHIQANWDGEFTEELIKGAKYAHRDERDTAANIGSIAHDHIEQYIKAAIRGSDEDMKHFRTSLPDNPQSANGVIAALEWMDRHKVRWIFTERKIYSRDYNFAGTADGLAMVSSCGNRECCNALTKTPDGYKLIPSSFDNVLSVPDWKTSNQIYPEYFYQTAAYALAFTEEYPHRYVPTHRFICRLGKDDAKFQAIHRPPETLGDDTNAFLSALNLYETTKRVVERGRENKATIRAILKTEKEERKTAEKAAKNKKEEAIEGRHD